MLFAVGVFSFNFFYIDCFIILLLLLYYYYYFIIIIIIIIIINCLWSHESSVDVLAVICLGVIVIMLIVGGQGHGQHAIVYLLYLYLNMTACQFVITCKQYRLNKTWPPCTLTSHDLRVHWHHKAY